MAGGCQLLIMAGRISGLSSPPGVDMSKEPAQAETLQTSTALPTREQATAATGRRTTYCPATAELIAARLADGETLSSICRTPGMPRRQTVHQWRMKIPAFADLYARAREIGMESMADDVLTIADDDSGDRDADGKPNSASVQRARLQVDARRFLMSKLAPKVYGDRTTVEHTGTVEQRVTLSDRERLRRLATFLEEDKRAGVLIEGTASRGDGDGPGPDSPRLPASFDEHGPGAIDEPRARRDDV